MGKKFKPALLTTLFSFTVLFFSAVAYADDYPGVYASENSLVFIPSADAEGILQGAVVLSYEYSMDWVITVGETAVKNEAGLFLRNGHQYIYRADGTRLSEIEYTTLDLTVPWDEFEFQVLPSHGRYLAPMVRGGLAYSLVETKSGLPSQIALASDALDSGEILNLFDGFLYQISGGEISAQIAYTEIAFGSQGLVRGIFPENFPPPPEDYPVNYPEYDEQNYPPPPWAYQQPTTDNYIPSDPLLPMGKPVPEDELINRPHFTLDPLHDYDIPPVAKLGLVAFQDTGDIPGFTAWCEQLVQEKLGEIEGLEIVYIPYDESLFGGAVIYDRATWLCSQLGVDALLMTELDDLNIPGGDLATSHYQRTSRVQIKFESKLIEGMGGSIFWTGEFDADKIHDTYEIESDRDTIIRGDLGMVIDTMISDLKTKGALDGGHVD